MLKDRVRPIFWPDLFTPLQSLLNLDLKGAQKNTEQNYSAFESQISGVKKTAEFTQGGFNLYLTEITSR